MEHYIGQLGQIAVRSYLGGQHADRRRIAQHVGAEWAIPAIEKAAVSVNPQAIAIDPATGVQLNGSVDQMTSRSLALMAKQRGAVDWGLRAGLLQLDEVSPTAGIVDENDPAPIAVRVPSGVVLVSPNKVVFPSPITLELARSEFAAQAIQARAEDAVSRGIDSALISLVAPGSGGSLGASSDALADVRSLIELISITGAQPLIFGAAPDVSARMATLRQAGTIPFPGACATGQSEVAGLPMLATDRVAAGSLLCIDPSGLAIHIEEISVQASQNASILMSDAPDLPANLTSAFQVGMIVVVVTCRFSLAVIRQQDVSGELSSIAWANS